MLSSLLVVPLAGAGAAPSEKSGPLSPRLQELARPDTARLPAAAQNRKVGLAESGEGRLLRRANGRVLVDVRVSDRAAIGAAVEAADVRIVARAGRLATLAVDPTRLTDLAGVAGLVAATEVLAPMLSRAPGPDSPDSPGPVTNAVCPTGVISQGDGQLRAALARATYGVDGTGVKVGVLSDSYNNVGGAAADVASGDLPGPGNPCGHPTPVTVVSDLASGGIDEGRAMLQIVHDLAPGSPLLFATAFNGQLDFANQIIALKNAGAKVIVDDVGYFAEPMFQDGVIAAAINTVRASGVSYFSSAGNSNLTLAGKSVSSYEAPSYRPTSCPAAVVAYPGGPFLDCHDFDPGAGTSAIDVVTMGSVGTMRLSLGWSQPQYGVTNDLDFFLIEMTTGNLVAASVDDNPGSGIPSEFISGSVGPGSSFGIVIARYSGTATPRLKWISHRSPFSAVQWNTGTGGDVIGPSIFGHNAALAAATIAAVPHSNSNVAEPFTSQGPARYCWQPVNGTTPAASKPCEAKYVDFAATDGVVTTLGASSGLNPFFGTSASAPHAAAVNALMRQAQPCRTEAQLRAAEAYSGRPVGSAPFTSVGFGLIDAVTSISNLGQCSSPTYSVSFSNAVAANLAQASTYFGVSQSETLLLGARILRYIDVVTTPPGLGVVSPAPTSSGPVTYTSTYTVSAEQTAMQALAARMGLSMNSFHTFGAQVLIYLWFVATH